MRIHNGRFKFERDDLESSSNCFHCEDDLLVMLFDKVKDDYVQIRKISGKPNSCDYVIVARNVRSGKTEIWLIEEKDVILKLVQKLKDLKKGEYNDSEISIYELFINTIVEIFSRVVSDFIYSATVLSDILDSCGIAIYDLNDKGKYNFVCRILYRREQLDEVDPPELEQVVDLMISSMGLLEQAIFITPEDLCSELKNYSDVNVCESLEILDASI